VPVDDLDAETDTPPVAANAPVEGLWLGHAEGTPVAVPLAALPTHVAVVGAAGSGKTWLAKAVTEEAALAGVAVLAVDPQGDLVQFLRPADQTKLAPAEVERANRFRRTAAVRVLTPGTDHGVRVSLNPLKLSSGKGEDAEDLLRTTAGHLVTLAQATGEVDSQRTFLFQLLRVLTRGPTRDLTLGGVADALRDPDSVGLEAPDRFVKRTERERLARQLNNLEYGPSARLFTGGRPLDLGWLVAPPAKDQVPLNVVYLNALADDAEKQGFVAALAVEVYRWMMTSGGSTGRPRLLFYLDEARDYLPAGTAQPPAKKPLLRLFAQGRKYGVACLVCTQSPRSVDYNVFSNCSTKLIGRLESAQDVERVRDWFAPQGSPPGWLSRRVGSPAGVFVGRWPGQLSDTDGVNFRSRNLLTAHEGGWSPERVAAEVASAVGHMKVDLS
jgi:DNA helicase HerA-like ATPase